MLGRSNELVSCRSRECRVLSRPGATREDRVHRPAVRRKRSWRRFGVHCRLIAERMAERHEVEVLTTCARDYVTGPTRTPRARTHPRGDGAAVRRPSPRHRGVQPFLGLDLQLPATPDDEQQWLRRQGPWCPLLVEYLQRHHASYDVLIFLFTYLYAPRCSDCASRRSAASSCHGPRRTRHPPRPVSRGVRDAGCGGVQHRSRAQVPAVHLRHPSPGRGGRRVRSRPLAESPGRRPRRRTSRTVRRPAEASPGARRGRDGGRPVPGRMRGLRLSAAATGSVSRRAVRPAASTRARGARALRVLPRLREGRRRRDARTHGRQMMPIPRSAGCASRACFPSRSGSRRWRAATVVAVPSPFESLSLLPSSRFAVGTRSWRTRAARCSSEPTRAQQCRPLSYEPGRVQRGPSRCCSPTSACGKGDGSEGKE